MTARSARPLTAGPLTDGRALRQLVRELKDGKSNNTGRVTLRPGELTTPVADWRAGPETVVLLSPETASAATAAIWIAARSKHGFVIGHDADAATDRHYRYVLVG